MITVALELTPGRFDLVEFTVRGVIRRDSVTGKPVWDAANPKSPYAASRDPGPWLRRFAENRWTLHVVEPAFDCDGDGTRDVLLVSGGNENACIAFSGADGSVLWNYLSKRDGPGGPLTEGPGSPGKPKPDDSRGAMIGWPSIGDVDRDGTPDLIATAFPLSADRPGDLGPIGERTVVIPARPRLYRDQVTVLGPPRGSHSWSPPDLGHDPGRIADHLARPGERSAPANLA
jgi:hypothetical protein